MNTEEKKILILTNRNIIGEILDKIIEEDKRLKEFKWYKVDNIMGISLSSVKLVIIDVLDKERQRSFLKNIKSNELLNNIPFVVSMDEFDEEYYDALIENNITEFIIGDYFNEKAYKRLKKVLDYIAIRSEVNNTELKFGTLLNNTPYMAWVKDRDCNYIMVNNEFRIHAGKTNEEICGRNDEYVWNKKVGGMCKNSDMEVMEEQKQLVFEEVIVGTRGEREFSIQKSPVIDESGNVVGTIGIARDITDEKKAEENIRRLAHTDYLTNLANRRGLYNYIEEKIEGKGVDLTVLFIDLDNFKNLNDTHGHYYGDGAIILLSQKIMSICKDDFVARIGGDEFVIVIEGAMEKSVLKKKINDILEATETEFKKDDKTYLITSSIGVVKGNIKSDTIENLLLKGDLALYKAKEKGKNQFVFYTDELEQERLFAFEIERDLKNSVANNEIEVVFQPIYTIDRDLKGFEALFRWNNEKYKDIPILEIIKVMEKCNIMDEIGESILNQSFEFVKKVNSISDKDIVVSVNISALQIMKDKFVEKLLLNMNKMNVNPEHIGIEITETVLLENIGENIEKIKKLKELGITISVDDFGTGYSSLNYLVKLPISIVKIDKSFIKGMKKGNDHRTLVRLIIEMSHSLSLQVVAEGVESQEQLDELRQMNANFIQGYVFSKPLSKEEALKLAKN